MIKKLTEDLLQWSLYKMSWLGRINAIKMTLLPRILYLFHSLPIPVTKLHINKLQSAIICFIWVKKVHRLSKNFLFRPRMKVPLGVLSGGSTHFTSGAQNLTGWVWSNKRLLTYLRFLALEPTHKPPPILAPTLSNWIALYDSLHKLN